MAYEQPGFMVSMMSEGAIEQFSPVTVNANGNVAAAGADDNPILGIAQMPASAEDPETIRVMVTGVSFAVGDSIFDAGETVAAAAGGKVTDSVNHICGIALTACGGDDEQLSVLLKKSSDKG